MTHTAVAVAQLSRSPIRDGPTFVEASSPLSAYGVNIFSHGAVGMGVMVVGCRAASLVKGIGPM